MIKEKPPSRLCKFCQVRYALDGRDYCEECDTILKMIKDLLVSYLDGTIDLRAKNFLPEIDFLFMRNSRVAAYFNVAWEVCLEFLVTHGGTINKDVIKELEATLLDTNDIISVLKAAEIISPDPKKQDLFIPGAVTTHLLNVRLKNLPFDHPEFYAVTREARAIICLAITLHIIESEKFKPREIWAIFVMLYYHMQRHSPTSKIEAKIPEDSVMIAFKMCEISDRQRYKLIRDMVGLHPGGTRLIKDWGEDETMVLKKEVVHYLEYVRERLRERERGVSL